MLCEGNSDDCTRLASTTRDDSDGYLPPLDLCAACAAAYDKWLANYDPPDPDGEEMFRDHAAEGRDQMEAARRLK